MRRKFIAASRAHLLFIETFPAARSRALFARHKEWMTTYVTPYDANWSAARGSNA